MQENYGVNITFNVKDGTLKNANASVVQLNSNVASTKTSVNSLNQTFQNTFYALGSLNLAFSAIGASLGSTLKSSLELKSANEQLKLSLASLISLNHSNVDSMGRAIDANTKWNHSLKASQEVINKLNVINLKTIYTMQDMSEMFKSFYSTAGSSMSLEQAISAMEAIAYAGQVSGASVDSLKMTLDSLGAGVAQTQTDFGRFISSLGLSTEAMSKAKSEGKLYSIIIEKLGSFSQDASRSANTYEASVSNLSNALDELKKKAIEPYFEGIKESINAVSEALMSNQEVILRTISILGNLSVSFALSTAVSKVLPHLDSFAHRIDRIANSAYRGRIALKALKTTLLSIGPTAGLFGVIEAFSWWNRYVEDTQNKLKELNEAGKEDLEKRLKEAEKRLKEASDRITKARKSGGILDKFREQEAIGDYSKAHKEVEDLKHRISMLPKVAEKTLQPKKITPKLSANQIKDLNQAYSEIARVGMSDYKIALLDITEKSEKWTKAGVKNSEVLRAQNYLLNDLETKQALKAMMQDLELRSEKIALGNDGLEKSIELEKIRYEKALASLNARVAKEIELGEMSFDYAKKLYELEDAKHQKALINLQEEYRLKSSFTEYFSQSLSENFINIMDGGNFVNFGKNLQKSATQAFGRSLAHSFENSRVGKAMDKAFDLAITKASEGLGVALDGLFGKGFMDDLSQALGGVLAGIGIGQALAGVISSIIDKDHAEGAKKGGAIGSTLGGLVGGAIGWAVGGGPLGAMAGGLIGGSGGGLLGSLIGGFYNKKTEVIGEGLQVFQEGNKDFLEAKTYKDNKETKSYLWGLIKKEKHWTDYSLANAYALIQVRNTLRGFEHLITDINGSVSDLIIRVGRYSDYNNMADSVVKDVIKGVMGKEDKALIDGVYRMWSDYAQSIDKNVSQAIMESMNAYVQSTQNYTKWLYGFKGDTLGSARYTAELAQKEIDRLQESLGVSGINVDNFLTFREEMIKNAFDPNTINLINALGQALMDGAEASKKFEEALKKENKTKLKAIDPFLKQTKSLKEAREQKGEIESKISLKILSTLQRMLKTQEASLYGGVG